MQSGLGVWEQLDNNNFLKVALLLVAVLLFPYRIFYPAQINFLYTFVHFACLGISI